MKKCHYFILFLMGTVISQKGIAQAFLNTNLDGIIVGWSSLPNNWQSVPFNDPICLATSPGSATPDLTSLTGPQDSTGIMGNSHSDTTFVSGTRGNYFQEGIMQTVSGFTIGDNYTIEFYQSIVKQMNCLDQSGSWAVYVDTTLITLTSPTFSTAPFNSTSFIWEQRSAVFTALANSHTIKFLPADDDLNISSSLTDITGCLRMGIDDIQLLCNHEAELGNDTILCQGEILTLNATVANANYLWQNNSSDSILNVSQPGSYWVEVDVNGCVISDTINVSFNIPPQIDFGADTTLCQGEILTLDVTTPNSTYLWQDNSTSSIFSINQPGVYWAQVSGVCGIFIDTLEVFYNPVPTINLGIDTVLCQGDSIILNGFTAGGTYLWQDGSTAPTYNVMQQGVYWVKSTSNNCQTSDTIDIVFDQIPIVELGNDTTLCPNESIFLSLTNFNATYLWQDGTTGASMFINQNGIYWVEATNQCGIFSDSIEVVYNSSPIVNLGGDTSICLGDSIFLDVTQLNYSYLWQDGSTSSTFKITQPGTYSIEVTLDGCSSFDNIKVNTIALLELNLGQDTSVCMHQELILNATQPKATYLWQDGSVNQSYIVVNSGLYTVMVSNFCETLVDSISVELIDCETEIIAPTVFTPNRDGFNDLFSVNAKGIKELSAVVFNRWGQEVWRMPELNSIKDISMHNYPIWDGRTSSGIETAEGTYYYVLNYVSIYDEVNVKKGAITLLR